MGVGVWGKCRRTGLHPKGWVMARGLHRQTTDTGVFLDVYDTKNAQNFFGSVNRFYFRYFCTFVKNHDLDKNPAPKQGFCVPTKLSSPARIYLGKLVNGRYWSVPSTPKSPKYAGNEVLALLFFPRKIIFFS